MFFLTIISAGTAALNSWSINHAWIIGNLLAAFFLPIVGATAMSFYITARDWRERATLALVSGTAHAIGSTITLLLMRGRH
jgi:hypothetical protein